MSNIEALCGLKVESDLLYNIISALLAIRIAEQSAIVTEHVVPRLSVHTCVLWQNGWLDLDAVWGGEWGRARKGCIRFWWWSSKGKGQFGGEFAARRRPIVTNGDFVASLCESA